MDREAESLLTLATDVVQAQERLHNAIKKRHKDAGDICQRLFPDSVHVLDQVRDIRSRIDGSHFSCEPAISSADQLQDLKPFMLMHVPTSVNQKIREKFQKLILDSFQGSCRKVLFACLVTCPWYLSAHTDRGQQAKHNRIFVVYASRDTDVFCPCSRDLKIRNDVIDQGWFYALEVSMFVQYLSKGKGRFVEVLFSPPGAVLHEDPEWTDMDRFIQTKHLTGLRGFIEQCKGQAVGGVAKKNKSGRMVLQDSATLHQFCESFRLLHHFECVLEGCDLLLGDLRSCDLSDEGQAALRTLHEAYLGQDVKKADLLSVLMTWKEKLESRVRNYKSVSQNDVLGKLGQWLAHVRTHRGQIVPNTPAPLGQDATAKIESLMLSIGGNLQQVAPSQVVMIARAGSFLYDLHTEASDVDYIIIYAESTQDVISAVKPLCEIKENRGPQKHVEYGAYEARMFCDMLWKGSIVILELVFSDNLEYMSPMWKELISHREEFVTENAILQYLGIIRNNLRDIQGQKYIDNPKREGKIFYQIFHKLESLEYFLKGCSPPVKCTGDAKEFIMRIRQGPLKGDLSRDNLQSLAEDRLDKLLMQLAARKTRLREQANMDVLTEWLMKVRGWMS